MAILYLVDQTQFTSGSGIYTYVNNLYESIKTSKFSAYVLIIGLDIEKNSSYKETDFILFNKSDPKFLKNFSNLIEEREIDIVHFHSIFDFEFQNTIVSKIKALNKNIILTIHNNTLLCFKGTMAYKNQYFCKNNSSFSRCNACLADRHKFGTAVYLLNIMNRFLRFSKSNKLSYFKLLENFSNQSKYITRQMDFVIVLDNWVLEYLPLHSDTQLKTVCIPQSVKPSQISKEEGDIKGKLEKKLVYLGRTDLTKGLLILIRAMKNIRGISLDCYIDVTDEKYFSKITSEVKNNKLNVRFFPLLDHNLLLEKLLKYDLLCMPTFSEMSPLLSLEALSIKLPVLASDHPSFLSQAKDNRGISTFKNGSIKSLRAKIKDLSIERPENIEYKSLYEESINKHKILYNSLLKV